MFVFVLFFVVESYECITDLTIKYFTQWVAAVKATVKAPVWP